MWCHSLEKKKKKRYLKHRGKLRWAVLYGARIDMWKLKQDWIQLTKDLKLPRVPRYRLLVNKDCSVTLCDSDPGRIFINNPDGKVVFLDVSRKNDHGDLTPEQIEEEATDWAQCIELAADAENEFEYLDKDPESCIIQ